MVLIAQQPHPEQPLPEQLVRPYEPRNFRPDVLRPFQRKGKCLRVIDDLHRIPLPVDLDAREQRRMRRHDRLDRPAQPLPVELSVEHMVERNVVASLPPVRDAFGIETLLAG